MEDKEIIINDVDVAGCEYMLNNKIKGKQHCPAKAMPYAKETSCICRKSIDTPYNFCKHNPNCHYKQLKRLEFELKVTKADYEASEQENKRLIESLGIANKYVNKYHQTLQEIDEIISRTDSHHPPSVVNMVSIIRHKLYELTKAEEE